MPNKDTNQLLGKVGKRLTS